MKYITAYHQLIRLIALKMQTALHVGRYAPPYTVNAFLTRDKSRAFRCMAYKGHTRDIAALTLAAETLLSEAIKTGQCEPGWESLAGVALRGKAMQKVVKRFLGNQSQSTTQKKAVKRGKDKA